MTEPDGLPSSSRPGPSEDVESRALATPDLVTELQRLLGVRLVAYIAGVATTSAITAWADNSDVPKNAVEGRLRLAYRLARLLEERYSATTIQTWFRGADPTDHEPAPATLIRTSDPDAVATRLMAAATDFAFVS